MRREIILKIKDKFPNCVIPNITDGCKNIIYNGSEVWLCEYDYTSVQKPILGMILYMHRRWRFYPFVRNKEIRKSTYMSIENKIFTKTKNESIAIYNSLVSICLEELKDMVNKIENDYIK